MSRIPAIEGHCDPHFARVREVFAESFASGAELGASVAVTRGRNAAGRSLGRQRRRRRHAAVAARHDRESLLDDEGIHGALRAPARRSRAARSRRAGRAVLAGVRAAGKESIRVRHLLCHQAGLSAIRRPFTMEEFYDWDMTTRTLAAETPWWEPGTAHGYHALTFGHLVGEVVRRISGRSLGTFFRDEVATAARRRSPYRSRRERGRARRRADPAAGRRRSPRRRARAASGPNPELSRSRARQSRGRIRSSRARAPGAAPRFPPRTDTATRARWRASTPRSRAAAASTASRCCARDDRRGVDGADVGLDLVLQLPMHWGLGYIVNAD